MNKYSAVQWSPGGAQLSTRGPHALTGGPSVQVQFPHLKISTLTTGHSVIKIDETQLGLLVIAQTWKISFAFRDKSR